jgi:hypothetical protein
LLGECPDSSGVVQDEYKIRELETNLPSEPCTPRTYGRRRAPSTIRKFGNDNAITISRGPEESGLDNREDCETLRF